jgi:hypothetical protein
MRRRYPIDERYVSRSYALCRAVMNSEIHKFGGVDRPAVVSLRRDVSGLFLALRSSSVLSVS